MKCHACASTAIVRVRVVPRSVVTLFDAAPRDILACQAHIEAAKAIGTVLSMTPLSDATTLRAVAE